MPYSMPLRRNLTIAGGSRCRSCAGGCPRASATVKCPSSWRKTSRTRPTMTTSQVTRPEALSPRASRSRSASSRSSRSRAGAPSTARARRRRRSGMPRKGSRPARNAATATSLAALNTHGWTPPLSPASRASASIGNVSRSGAWNSSVSDGQVERRQRRRGALRVGQRVRDRHAHVRVAEVRERRAVAEAHERVHDRRRLDDDLDPLVRELEEEVRLDQLEPLVRERGRVDGDLRAHAPGRMRERLVRRDVAELVAGAAAERPAGAGQHEARDLVGRGAGEALEERRVLAVHRKDPAAAARRRGEREVAAGDEALLVREREVDAVLERPQRRVDAGEADDGVEDDVGLRLLEQLDEVAADLLQRRVHAVQRRRARGDRAELQLRDGPRRSRSPAGRSSRWRRAGRRASRAPV